MRMFKSLVVSIIAMLCINLSIGFMTRNTYYSRTKSTSIKMTDDEKKKEVIGKGDLVNLLKDKTGFTKSGIEVLLTAFTGIIQEEVLGNGKEIRIRDFGTFKQRNSAPRKGRNPKTGEEIAISGSKSVTFTAASSMKTKTDGGAADE